MRLGNKRGFTGIEVMAVVAIIGLITYFAAPPTIKAVGTLFSGGDKNQQKAVHKIDRTRTLYEVDPMTNKMKPVKETYSEYSNEFMAQEPPETLWTKFWHLGAIAVVIIMILSYLGLWPIIALWWNKKIKPKIAAAQNSLEELQTQHDELTADAKRIVISIDEGLLSMDAAIKAANAMADATVDPAMKVTQLAIAKALTDMKASFLAAMSKKQDSTTKLLVSELKND